MDETRDEPAQKQPTAPSEKLVADRVRPYVPRIVQQHLLDDPASRWWTAEGTAAFVDVSGFTQLSEQLAAKGREGAEQITDVVRECFESILYVAYQNDGGLLKFGGDALLLWFHGEGHAERACLATVLMRKRLHDIGEIELRDVRVKLEMAQGVHSGAFHFFIVGTSHFEFLPVGPAWTRLAAMERVAGAGEIVVSVETAALLPSECLGEHKGLGFVLARQPPGESGELRLTDPPAVPPDVLARCLSPSMRAHVLAGAVMPELRPVTISFIRFEGTDALIEQHGADATADALHRLVTIVEAATEEQDVCFLGSDVDSDGGKLILTGGAPKVTGNDEERMLLALRRIVSSDLPIPIRVGVHRGAVFAGDIGPAYRRTYTVMGDAVNLTARLMAKAEPGHVYATRDVLVASNTLFETVDLEPFPVKGKAEPVVAWDVGPAQGSRTREATLERLPLTGRNTELGVIRKAFASARAGEGRLVEAIGDAGIGKTRLLEALRDAAAGFRKLHAICETYTSSTPYAVWSELLRELLGFGRGDADEAVVARLREEIGAHAPDLAPWLPLLGAALRIEIESTPEVDMLAEKNRRTKLNETVAQFVSAMVPERMLVEIENAQHMDEASSDLLSHLIGNIASHPWLIAVSRRPSLTGFKAPDLPTVVAIELKPLAPADTLRMAQLATAHSALPTHVLELVAKRSGGNPQFLRDLLRTAVESGGTIDLPDSAEAAAMARIDSLAPEERALVRRAAVFGLTFHPRMLSWFTDEDGGAAVGAESLVRLREFFDEEPDGYLRFRNSLLRDAAYEGLPFKLRRQLHQAVAEHVEAEMDYPEEAGDILSLHYFAAGDYRPAWRYAAAAAKRAEAVYAHVEAATLYSRALEAGRQLSDLAAIDVATAYIALGDAWYTAGEFSKASDAYKAARELRAGDAILDARLLFKLSRVEGKLGQFEQALRLAQETRVTLSGIDNAEAARQTALAGAWSALILQSEGRSTEALDWAERTIAEAGAADAFDALAEAYCVKSWAYGQRGDDEAVELMQRSLGAYQRSANLGGQADALANLGVVCQLVGRWDEAQSYYEQGRAAALKIGDTVGAALAHVNIAEILADRGEWAEAEKLLLATTPLWRASQYRYYLGACLILLGQALMGQGRFKESIDRLDEAKACFVQAGAEGWVPRVEARIAECRVAMGDTEAGSDLARKLLDGASASYGAAGDVPLLHRVQGHALLRQGDLWGARDALEASLAAAREQRDLFEAALTQLSLIELDRLEGVEPPLEMVDESRTLLARLKVRAVPPVPAPAQ